MSKAPNKTPKKEKMQPARGTRDLLGDECRRHRHVEDALAGLASRYGYDEISTPVFEATEVFTRTLGETSDIVTKEMYTFEKKEGEPLTLRPENTAGVARAFISGGHQQNLPFKVFYRGPMFRYERPQKGRQRQFHQVGVELIGVAEPAADVEVIAMGADLLAELGVLDAATLELNTLGDSESRMAYRNDLVDYLSQYERDLSNDSRARLARNPLRILDSKDEGDRKIVAGAPKIIDSLNDSSRAFFDDVLAGLDTLGIAYTLNSKLVRGLDYYCHTAFEFTTDQLGAQGALVAGGRYDGLIEDMGGQPTPGIGWAAGIERLAMMLAETPLRPRPIAIIAADDGADDSALTLARSLRRAGFVVEAGYAGNLKKRMKRANQVNAQATIFLGLDDLVEAQVRVKDMDSGEEKDMAMDALEGYLGHYRS